MRLIKITIIGCGAVTERYYVPALKEIERLGLGNLVSAVDRDNHWKFHKAF